MNNYTGFTFRLPGLGVAKERPRFNPKSKSVRTPERTKEFEKEVEWRARESMKKLGNDVQLGPMQVEITIFRNRKEGDEASRPMDRGDVDNLAKGILDAMNEVVYKDDKQVTTLTSMKRFTTIEPYISVAIYKDEDFE